MVKVLITYNEEKIRVSGATAAFEKSMQDLYEIIFDEEIDETTVEYTIRKRPHILTFDSFEAASMHLRSVKSGHPEYKTHSETAEDGTEYIVSIFYPANAPGSICSQFIAAM